MKKIVLFIVMIFALFIVPDYIYAETDSGYDTALQYYNSGQYEEAARLFKEYVKKRPDSSAYYRIAYALYKLGRFDEANKYFKDVYLINPLFSPVSVDWVQRYRQGKPEKTSETLREQVPPEPVPLVSESIEEQPALIEEAAPIIQPPEETQQQGIQEPVVTSEETLPFPLPEPQEFEPQMQPPARVPVFPGQRQDMPISPPEIPMGLMAGFTTFFFLIDLAIYIFFCLCLFLIAKKADVSAAWTAWIPIVNIWTIVASAGKPWWWLLLLLIPIVNIFVASYLWMCVSENLGRNKWLGLLMLLPIVNFIFLGFLAFSKPEEASYVERATAV